MTLMQNGYTIDELKSRLASLASDIYEIRELLVGAQPTDPAPAPTNFAQPTNSKEYGLIQGHNIQLSYLHEMISNIREDVNVIQAAIQEPSTTLATPKSTAAINKGTL